MSKTYGIEAARATIVSEVDMVFDRYGKFPGFHTLQLQCFVSELCIHNLINVF